MKKKYIIIAVVLLIGAIALGSTLAWWTWSTSSNEQTNVVVTVGGITIDYEDGDNITNNNLIPTSTKEKGISKNITVSSTGQVYLDLNMAVVTLDDGLKDASFKYEIYNGSDLVTGGNFANSNAGDNIVLLSGVEVTSSSTTYTLYIWIDGNMSNPNTMYNQNFEFRLNAEATDEIQPLKSNGANYIESLLIDNPNTMHNDDPDSNVRYMGLSPNNYISFNNEIWRIIGVFNVKETENGTFEKRLKIIRNDSIEYRFDENFNNDWSISALKDYLNEDYYNSIDASSRNLIGDTYWNLGGGDIDLNATEFYVSERGTMVYSGRPTYWIGKIGLIYPSDYAYATSGGSDFGNDLCFEIDIFDWMSFSDCYDNNYMYLGTFQQTITPGYDNSNDTFMIDAEGYLETSSSGYYSTTSRPVLFLKSDVQITGGDGSQSNPFTLSIQ